MTIVTPWTSAKGLPQSDHPRGGAVIIEWCSTRLTHPSWVPAPWLSNAETLGQAIWTA